LGQHSALQAAGDPEIDQVGELAGSGGVGLSGDQDVGRFDVTVHQPTGVGGVESGAHLDDDRCSSSCW
jgi:hypothetical protein